jgi:radical SAM superfamily enzyme YgiQ (UPF0313 family)
MMANVYLISPPYENVYKKLGWKQFREVAQPPLGLAYIASYLQQRGHKTKLFDTTFSAQVLGDIEKHIRDFSPDYVAMTATTPQITSAFIIAEFIKARFPDIKIILGGPHASALPEETVSNKDIDMVVCGEGEITVSEIADNLPRDKINGICYKNGAGRPLVTPPRPLIESLDDLPFPSFEQLPIKKYFYFFPENSVGISTGRGCPHDCSFCASRVINRNHYRARRPEKIVEEVNYLYKKYGITSFIFWEDTFTINRNRVEEICSLIIRYKLPIRWWCTTRADDLTPEMLKRMKSAGCHSIGIGIESGDERVLKATGKGINLSHVKKAVSWAHNLGIKPIGYFILGLPYETPESLRNTLKFAKSLDLYYAQFQMLAPLPGTAIWDTVQTGKLLRCTTNRWEDFTRYGQAIVESDYLTGTQLRNYHKRLVREYYSDPKFIFRTLSSIRSFREFFFYLKKILTLCKVITS